MGAKPATDQQLHRRARAALDRLRADLLAQRTGTGHWVGRLSPSPLSTATAVSAMSAVLLKDDRTSTGEESKQGVAEQGVAEQGVAELSPESDIQGSTSEQDLRSCIASGIEYLRGAQNDDGGFGDTDRSHSNIATSYLVLAASTLAERAAGRSLAAEQRDRLGGYIQAAGSIDALRRRYGKDKTFVVPIMTNLAIAGLVCWDDVAALPFEAAVFPQSMYRMLQMPVVSYAIPALVAIGQARHFHGRKAIWPLRAIRAAAVGRSMKVLERMQPDSGGYLEATPLTSFVVMSLAATDRCDHRVSRRGLSFLIRSMNGDGSWPIDTNLATWVTSLAIHALASDPDDDGSWCRPSLVEWHLACQHTDRHPFTGAEPGGWGWSDLSGAVPDSDDTPAAILALRQTRRWVDADCRKRCDQAIEQGALWLRKLQNRDGGWPTFCRGWGKLPFDRSSNDLTAHAMRALLSEPERRRRERDEQTSASPAEARSEYEHRLSASRLAKAIHFLEVNQQPDGSWLPLWFGNQDRADESNPVYGTSRVLVAAALDVLPAEAARRGCDFLIAAQNEDGGWGGGPSVTAWLRSLSALPDSPGMAAETVSSVEETALAVDALTTVLLSQRVHSRSHGDSRNPRPNRGVESGRPGDENPAKDALLASGGNDPYREAIIRGIEFLLGSVDDERHRVPWPIGFYFAKLWYHERLYPLIFTITALGKYLRAVAADVDPNWPR